MEALSLDIMSSPDEELKVEWEVSRTPSPDITIVPEVSSRPYLVETDLNLSVDSVSSPPPPSLDSFFPCSLIEDSAFSIEKVLGPTTANILAEAEAEASKYANGLQNLEIEWSEDTNEPHRILTCQICQLFVRTVDRLLDKSEQLMDHYLPLTEEEIASLKKAVEEMDDSSTDHEMQVCFARISNLSGKLRQRAYMMALSKLRLARKNTEENLAQLQQTIDLIGQVQHVDAMDYQKSFEKLTEISIQWTQRNSLPQQSVCLQTESFSPGSSIDEIGPRVAQSSDNEDLGVSISISSKVEEKQEIPIEGEIAEMVSTFSTEIHYREEIEVVPSKEVTPPPDVSSEKLPSPPAEVEPEAPPSPPAEVEPEVPPGPPEEVEPEVPSPPEEVEPEVPPGPPEEVEPEEPSPPEEVEPEVPPSPPEEVEPEVPSPPEEVEPEVPPVLQKKLSQKFHQVLQKRLSQKFHQVLQKRLSQRYQVLQKRLSQKLHQVLQKRLSQKLHQVLQKKLSQKFHQVLQKKLSQKFHQVLQKRLSQRYQVLQKRLSQRFHQVLQKRLSQKLHQVLQKRFEPEAPPSPPEEVEPEVPPSPPEEIEPEVPRLPEEVEPEAPPSPPEEIEPEVPPSPPEVEPEVPPSPPREVEPEVLPSPPAEVVPEVLPSPKLPTPPPEVEPKKPPTPPPEVTTPPKSVSLTPVEKVHRDVAHITLTTPGCDEDDTLLVRMARSEEDFASEVETKTLEMSRSLTSNLKNTYESLLTNLKDLPSNLQNKLYQTCRDMSELHSTFASAHCFSDLSSGLLNKSFAIMAEAQGSMDELMEFALQSPKALLWLKDYLPPILTKKRETQVEAAESKDEAKGEVPPYDMRDTESNILKIQKAYEPRECYNDTLFVKKEEAAAAEVVPPSSLRESEDILKIQEAYDPQGCKEDVTPSRGEKEEEEEEEGPSPRKEGSKNWGILKLLVTYVPKISTIHALLEKKNIQSSGQKEEEEVPAQEEEEALPSRDDILKLLQAYDPKGCEESFNEMEVSDPDQREFLPPSRADILKLLKAYEPQECLDDTLPSKEEKVEMEVSRISIKEAPSIKKVEVPPPVQKEVVIPLPIQKEEVIPPPVQVKVVIPPPIQKEEVIPPPVQVEVVIPPPIQKEEVIPPPVQVEEVPPSTQVEEVLSSIQMEEIPSSIQVEEDVPPPVQEEMSPPTSRSELEVPSTKSQLISSMDNILKLEANKSNNNNEVPPSTTEEEKQPLPEKPKNLLDIQKAYEPKECEDGSSIRRQVDEASSSAPGDQVDILKIQRAYDLKECEEMTPYREAEEESSTAASQTSGGQGWSIFKLVQSYLPKSLREDPSKKEEEDK
ncbi:titin-like isoform X2 [Pantherophis guttatus]|nr:titin-like isoform X2 [Pantherophis guttatus]